MKGRIIREACIDDLSHLDDLEQRSFNTDRLTRRRIKHWISASNRVFLVASSKDAILGYVLVIIHRGTRLARLYSLAVDEKIRGQGVAYDLMQRVEQLCAEKGRLYMRLEVARDNHSAIKLYASVGYTTFGIFQNYYTNHQDALRMQKRIRHISSTLLSQQVPWYCQTTDFTCGPAALMMAMGSLNPKLILNQELELDLWREATTIFMTSGHGGCHPLGLALAASQRGFYAETWINQEAPLFIESVRSPSKKAIMKVVDHQFRERCINEDIPVHNTDFSHDHIAEWLAADKAVITLISTYRMDGRKAPHWVAVTAIDELCLYVHDPDPDEGKQIALDCQYLPIARDDFYKMSFFGQYRLRTAVVISK